MRPGPRRWSAPFRYATRCPSPPVPPRPTTCAVGSLGSAPQPWVGLAEATGRVALPELPALESTTALFTGVTRVRGPVEGPDRWRADDLTPVGERDVYRLDGREYVWDFGFDQLTMLSGDAALRLPRAADLLPPDLGRRLLRLAPDDPVTPPPARRIAGLRTDGLRLTPSDPDTTIGRIDVWADPVTGLPLHFEVAPRSNPGVPLLASAMQEVVLEPPAPTALVPPRPPGSSRVQAKGADLSGALHVLDAPDPPAQLAGRWAVRGGRGGSVLLVGTIAPPVLERAVVELSGHGGEA